MNRIRMIIQYEGTNYVGWQRQKNGISVQERLEAELYKLTGEDICVHGSGRTDSGVHARAQVAHFDTQSRIPPDKFAYALNAGLAPDIRIVHSSLAPGAFHARFNVEKKHYRYLVWHGPHANPFLRSTALHVHHPLDMGAMQEAAALILGEHDFRAFKATGVEMRSTVRTIYASGWNWVKAPSLLCYEVAGSGFLYNMVRILAGTMLEIGGGRRTIKDMALALASGERQYAGPTAPGYGLMLWRVEYPGFDTEAHILPGQIL